MMNMKKKFILEFDEIPSLLFVSHDGRSEDIYENGVQVKHWRNAVIRSGIEQVTEYEIEKIVVPNRDSEVL